MLDTEVNTEVNTGVNTGVNSEVKTGVKFLLKRTDSSGRKLNPQPLLQRTCRAACPTGGIVQALTFHYQC